MRDLRLPWFRLLVMAAAWLTTAANSDRAQAQRPKIVPPAKASATKRTVAEGTLFSYAPSEGETLFALSLGPRPKSPRPRPHDIAVLFDTSASQTGDFLEKGLSTLQALLESLSPLDRVALFAVDINAQPLTTGLIEPMGEPMDAALDRLRRRVPLGSTDMPAAIDAAVSTLAPKAGPEEATQRPRDRAIVYLGDGMSTAQLFTAERMNALVQELVRVQASVTSYAIGPQLDGELLATLANQTGGMLVIDTSEMSAGEAADLLSRAALGAVIWPLRIKLPPAFVEVLPQRAPPLRYDRDTVLIGRVKLEQLLESSSASARPASAKGEPAASFEVSIRGMLAGKKSDFVWKIAVMAPADENAYLIDVVAAASRDRGVFLPTLGSYGLEELRRMTNEKARDLARLGQQALVTGNLVEARRLANEAVRLDPLNADAAALKSAIDKARRGTKKTKTRRLKLGD